MKTVLVDTSNVEAMAQALRSKGYVVFKKIDDLSYPEVSIILDILVREGYKIVSTK